MSALARYRADIAATAAERSRKTLARVDDMMLEHGPAYAVGYLQGDLLRVVEALEELLDEMAAPA